MFPCSCCLNQSLALVNKYPTKITKSHKYHIDIPTQFMVHIPKVSICSNIHGQNTIVPLLLMNCDFPYLLFLKSSRNHHLCFTSIIPIQFMVDLQKIDVMEASPNRQASLKPVTCSRLAGSALIASSWRQRSASPSCAAAKSATCAS